MQGWVTLGRQTPPATHRASTSALEAPMPKSGEVRRTALPPTFDGIRFEIGRMVFYVQEASKDPFMIEHTRKVCQEFDSMMDQAAQMNGGSLAGASPALLAVGAIDAWCRAHFCYVNDPPNIEVIQTPQRMVKQTRVPATVIRDVIQPFYQAMETVAEPSQVQAYEPPGICYGDCMPVTQKIIVRDRSDHQYKVVEIGSLRERHSYYHVVSYNENEKKFEFKPISKFVDKGVLRVYKVSLSNGVSFRCTENHGIYVFRRSGEGHTLTSIALKDLIRERKSSVRTSKLYTIPVAAQIPEAGLKNRFCPELSNSQLWVEGLYAAEGWSEVSSAGKSKRPKFRAKIGMNNPHAINALKTHLAVLDQPYGVHDRADGLTTVRMNVTPFTGRLGHLFGRNSAEKRFPDWYASLPKDSLSVLLAAYALGDGYVPTAGQWKDWVYLVYNTKSEKLATQLQFMHMVLGRPVAFYRQPAWKNKPAMYRLYEYKGYDKRKAPDLASVKIKSIECEEIEKCCDITVEDNHNFLLDGGALVHNCDEGGILFMSQCACSPADLKPLRFRFGGHEDTLHHVWDRVKAGDDWIDSDLTEEGYDLGDYSEFPHYEEVEVPL